MRALIPLICLLYAASIGCLGRAWWEELYFAPGLDAPWNEGMDLMSHAIAMFLAAYGLLSWVTPTSPSVRAVQLVVWSGYTVFAVAFVDEVAPFFKFANIVSCVLVCFQLIFSTG